MRIRLTWATVAFLAFAAPVLADDEYDACFESSDGTNVSWGQCGREWVEREDRRLNATWMLLTRDLEPETRKALLDEQRAWITFKDKSCLFYADGTFGREGAVLHYPQCRAALIAGRTEELRAIVDFIAPR